MRLLLLTLLVAALPACNEAPASIPKPSAQERHDATEAALARSPVPRHYAVGDNELLVLEVPLRAGRDRLQYQQCLVWRDREFKTATLQCPSDAADPGLGVGPEPER